MSAYPKPALRTPVACVAFFASPPPRAVLAGALMRARSKTKASIVSRMAKRTSCVPEFTDEMPASSFASPASAPKSRWVQ